MCAFVCVCVCVCVVIVCMYAYTNVHDLFLWSAGGWVGREHVSFVINNMSERGGVMTRTHLGPEPQTQSSPTISTEGLNVS